jgi:hypothetical protein
MSPKPQPHPGIWKHKAHPSDPDVKVADFSYQNEDLAQMIVQAWGNPTFAQGLTDHTNPNFAKTELANRGINLTNPVVLTETEYNNGWQSDSDDEVVFVLPNGTRASGVGGPSLLETAKLLMACVPNGI